MSPNDNRPRPYTKLNPVTGRVEWMAPEDNLNVTHGRLRSRPETDAEVRVRIKATLPYLIMERMHGKDLDNFLASHGMAKRGLVDETS